MAKVLEHQFSISPSNEYSGLISFRIYGFDLLAVQGTLKSLLHLYQESNSLSPQRGCGVPAWWRLNQAQPDRGVQVWRNDFGWVSWRAMNAKEEEWAWCSGCWPLAGKDRAAGLGASVGGDGKTAPPSLGHHSAARETRFWASMSGSRTEKGKVLETSQEKNL